MSGPATGAEAPGPGQNSSVTLHSSWSGLVLSMFGAGLVVVLAGVVIAGGAPVWVKVLAAAFAVAMIIVPLVDMPVSSVFDRSGVTRRAMLRKHRLSWHDVSRVERMRVGWWRTRRHRYGGLVARVGQRRYVLTDQSESGAEFDRLRSVLGDWADALGLGIGVGMRPPDEEPPTWLYRRPHWRPE